MQVFTNLSVLLSSGVHRAYPGAAGKVQSAKERRGRTWGAPECPVELRSSRCCCCHPEQRGPAAAGDGLLQTDPGRKDHSGEADCRAGRCEKVSQLVAAQQVNRSTTVCVLTSLYFSTSTLRY